MGALPRSVGPPGRRLPSRTAAERPDFSTSRPSRTKAHRSGIAPCRAPPLVMPLAAKAREAFGPSIPADLPNASRPSRAPSSRPRRRLGNEPVRRGGTSEVPTTPTPALQAPRLLERVAERAEPAPPSVGIGLPQPVRPCDSADGATRSPVQSSKKQGDVSRGHEPSHSTRPLPIPAVHRKQVRAAFSTPRQNRHRSRRGANVRRTDGQEAASHPPSRRGCRLSQSRRTRNGRLSTRTQWTRPQTAADTVRPESPSTR